VIPGASGGDGSVANPFQGVVAAQAVAQPGDVVFYCMPVIMVLRVRFISPNQASKTITSSGVRPVMAMSFLIRSELKPIIFGCMN